MGSKLGFMPPFAKGISGAKICCCLNAFYAINGVLNTIDGILLMLLGLFYANSLSANPPCFYPFDYFLIPYSTLICRPEKYCPFI